MGAGNAVRQSTCDLTRFRTDGHDVSVGLGFAVVRVARRPRVRRSTRRRASPCDARKVAGRRSFRRCPAREGPGQCGARPMESPPGGMLIERRLRAGRRERPKPLGRTSWSFCSESAMMSKNQCSSPRRSPKSHRRSRPCPRTAGERTAPAKGPVRGARLEGRRWPC